jgi:hypothetical protein
MEQLRQEVARVRGDFEVLQHDYSTYEAAGIGFQQDTDSANALVQEQAKCTHAWSSSLTLSPSRVY